MGTPHGRPRRNGTPQPADRRPGTHASPAAGDIRPPPDPLDVLFCDNHLLAVRKPAGLVTQPSGRHADSLEDRAKAWIRQRFAKPGNVFLEAVHRLDRPVSGIVLFARTGKALRRLNDAMRRGAVSRVYWTVLDGHPPAPEGNLEHWLLHGSHRARVANPGEAGARRALLAYRVLDERPPFSLVEVALATGRYHQIRAQWAAAGLPVVGDLRYGSSVRLAADTIALHHRCLTVPHPVAGAPLSLLAPLPQGPPWDAFPGPGSGTGMTDRAPLDAACLSAVEQWGPGAARNGDQSPLPDNGICDNPGSCESS